MADAYTGTVEVAANSALHTYMRSIAEPTLYANFEYWNWGTKAIQPGYTGRTLYAPTITKAVTSQVGAELTKTTDLNEATGRPDYRKLAFSSYTGTLNYYMDSFAITKVFAATATLRRYMERAAQFLMQSCALTQEELIHCELFWANEADFLSPAGDGADLKAGGTDFMDVVADGGSEAWGDHPTAAMIAGVLPLALAQARRKLRLQNNPGFPELGGTYAGLFSPNAVYSLLTNTTGPSFEADSMNITASYKNNIIGRLFGITVIETSNAPQFLSADIGTDSPDASNGLLDFEYHTVFAPDAFYVSEIETLQPKMYWSGFQVNTTTPAGEFGTLALDYSADAFSGDTANKMVVIPSSLGLADINPGA